MFNISENAINASSLRHQLEHPQAGGICVFEGVIRNHNEGKSVSGLFYQAFVEMAEREGLAIILEARKRFAIIDVIAVHRVGAMQIGELAVWVGVSAAHRDAAFAACRFVIDEIKLRVPIWKQESYLDAERQWLHPMHVVEAINVK